MTAKILSNNGAEAWVRQQHDAGLRVGFTCGAFDILHAGHVDYLERARGLCERLLVAVNSDASIRAYKSALRPVVPEEQRMAVVAGLAAVDAVTLMEGRRPAALLARLRPDLYIKGGDYSVEKLRSREVVEAYGGKAVVIPVDVNASSSAIIARAAVLGAHAEPEKARGSAAPIVFLDRDGTLVRGVSFLHEPGRLELLPGVGEGLARLQSLGFRLVLVTNQQGIGLGYFDMDAFISTNQALFKALAPFGVKIARVYFCPHSLADNCTCRKPAPGLLERALREMGGRASECFFIGDAAGDAEAAEAAGVRATLVGGGRSFADAVGEIAACERQQ